MREVLWAILGYSSGIRAVSQSRGRISTLRYRATVFGEAHVSDTPYIKVLTALASGAIFFFASQKFSNEWEMLAFGIFIARCLQLVLIDVDTHVLPRSIIISTYVLGLITLVLAQLTGADGSILYVVAGSFLMWVVLKVLELLSGGDLGAGDVSLGVLLGAYVGWVGLELIPIALSVAFLAGGLAALVLLLLRKADRRTMLPFGPFLIFGALVAVLR